MSTNEFPTNETKVVDFSAFKKKSEVNQEVSRGRKPLYLNHDDGRASGTNEGAKNATSSGEDFGDRLQNIRASLDRINNLMSELKKLSSHRDQNKPH
jgi:hypothetical protein